MDPIWILALGIVALGVFFLLLSKAENKRAIDRG